MSDQPNISSNSEIDQALKAFEKDNPNKEHPVVAGVITPQANQSTTKQVEGVSFDTEKDLESYKAISVYDETKTSKMVQAVMKYSKGSQRQAEWILLGFVIITIGISLYLVFRSREDTRPPVTPLMIEQMKNPNSH